MLCNCCNQTEINMLDRVKLRDGYICTNCVKSIGTVTPRLVQSLTVNEIKELVLSRNENADRQAIFTETKLVKPTGQQIFSISIDSDNKMFIVNYLLIKRSTFVFLFDELIGYEVYENGGLTETSGGLGAAVAGGVLFGAAGAIVGSNVGKKKGKSFISNITVALSTSVLNRNLIEIPILVRENKVNSPEHIRARNNKREVTAVLDYVLSNKTDLASTPAGEIYSEADEIRKFRMLANEGIITEEEFQIKKKLLLGI